MKYFVISLLFLVGCNGQQYCRSSITPTNTKTRVGDCYPDQIATRIHPELEVQVGVFSTDALNRDVPCHYTATIGFAKEVPEGAPPTTIGYCMSPFEVRIIRSFWDNASANQRMALMYHELGHCALRLEHVDDELDIMNSYIISDYAIEKNWDVLIEKMFRRAKK